MSKNTRSLDQVERDVVEILKAMMVARVNGVSESEFSKLLDRSRELQREHRVVLAASRKR